MTRNKVRIYKLSEGFDLSDISDTDYTETFSDADVNAMMERIADIKKWAAYNIFAIDWDVTSEATRNFIDDAVRVTAEPDGYHMSIVIPDSDFADELGMGQVTMNLFKSVKFGVNGSLYAMPEGSVTGMYPGLKLDCFDCSGYRDGELSIRVDTRIFKWSDLTPCFSELDSVRQLEIGSWTSDKKLKIDSLNGFPTIRGIDDFIFRLGPAKYKRYSDTVPFTVFFDDIMQNIRLRDVDPDAPSTVRIMVNYGMLSNPSSDELDIYDGVFIQNYNNYLNWNGAPNYIRYMTWSALRKYRQFYKPSVRAAMDHLIDGWEEKSDLGGMFTVNDNNSLHTDTPWTTFVVCVGGTYYVMDPKILERMTDGRWKRLTPLV